MRDVAAAALLVGSQSGEEGPLPGEEVAFTGVMSPDVSSFRRYRDYPR